MLCEHHIKNILSLQFADLNVERIKFQLASANLSRNYNAATMSKSLVFHCTLAKRNETSERIMIEVFGSWNAEDSIWNPVHLDRIGQIGTYWYVPVRTSTTQYKAVRLGA